MQPGSRLICVTLEREQQQGGGSVDQRNSAG
nr:MAG TPA: hypothetical protein [Caudoviricetes sp.]